MWDVKWQIRCLCINPRNQVVYEFGASGVKSITKSGTQQGRK